MDAPQRFRPVRITRPGAAILDLLCWMEDEGLGAPAPVEIAAALDVSTVEITALVRMQLIERCGERAVKLTKAGRAIT